MSPLTSNEYDIVARQGATYREDFSLTDDANLPVDLTGATIAAKFQIDNVKENITASITNAAEGKFRLVISSTVTALYGDKKGKYDVFITFSGGDKDCVLAGNITFQRSVTV